MNASPLTETPSRPRTRAALSERLPQAVLALVVLLGFAILQYELKDPPLDFHPTRQLRSAILARAVFYRLSPSADSLLRQRAAELAGSLEAYEPPIFEALVGLTYRLIGREVLWVSRVWLALFWNIGGLALFALARRFTSFYAALTGLMFYLFLPFSVIASRSFQPDPWMVMWLSLALWSAYRWMETRAWKWAVLTGLFSGITVLVKAVAAFPVGGMLLGLVLAGLGFRAALRSRQVWTVLAVLLVPSLVYYLFALGPRSSTFLSFWTVSLSRMVLTSQFYSGWLGMVHGLMGLTNILLALLGVLVAARSARAMLAGAWAGYALYGLVFPYQMTTHEYYHLMLLPLVALSLAPVARVVLERLSGQSWPWRALAAAALVFSALYCLWSARSVLYVANYASEPTAWKRMGEALPAEGRILALTSEYGNRLKYYGWRNIAGYWPFQADLRLSSLAGGAPMDFPAYFAEASAGMDYFLVTAFSELGAQPDLKAYLAENYPVSAEGDGFILYDLKHPLSK